MTQTDPRPSRQTTPRTTRAARRLARRPATAAAADPPRVRSIRATSHRWSHYQKTASAHGLTVTRWLTELADAASGYNPPANPPTTPPTKTSDPADTNNQPDDDGGLPDDFWTAGG